MDEQEKGVVLTFESTRNALRAVRVYLPPPDPDPNPNPNLALATDPDPNSGPDPNPDPDPMLTRCASTSS